MNHFAQCDTCAKYKQEKRKSTGDKDKVAQLEAEYKRHMEDIKLVERKK